MDGVIVVLSNGVVGAEKQAIALARAWGRPYRVLRILPHPLLARAPTSAQLLAARTFGARSALFDPSSPDLDALSAPLPAVAVSCGRASILASVYMRALGAGALRTVHIQHPRVPLCEFDRVILPAHDLPSEWSGGAAGWGLDLLRSGGGPPARHGAVLTSIGSLHAIDAAALAGADVRELRQLPRPRAALLIGGPTLAAPYSAEEAERVLGAAHAAVRAASGSLLVSTSRRSPPALVRAVERLAAADTSVRAWGAADEARGAANPFLGFLACADHLVVTADSVNMATEACAAAHFTGARVHLALGEACAPPHALQLRARGASRRLRLFLDSLLDGGAAAPFEARALGTAEAADSAGAGRQLCRAIALQPVEIARAVFQTGEDGTLPRPTSFDDEPPGLQARHGAR